MRSSSRISPACRSLGPENQVEACVDRLVFRRLAELVMEEAPAGLEGILDQDVQRASARWWLPGRRAARWRRPRRRAGSRRRQCAGPGAHAVRAVPPASSACAEYAGSASRATVRPSSNCSCAVAWMAVIFLTISPGALRAIAFRAASLSRQTKSQPTQFDENFWRGTNRADRR